jgi:hypothetical protein
MGDGELPGEGRRSEEVAHAASLEVAAVGRADMTQPGQRCPGSGCCALAI